MLKLQYFGHLIWRVGGLHWKRSWCCERLIARGEGGDRGWDCWMASLIQWTWDWANSGKYRRLGNPGMLQFRGLQRVGHNLATEKQHEGQSNGMESHQREPKSEARGRSNSKVPFSTQNIRWGSNYQTTPERHTWDSNPHPLTPSSKSPKCQCQVETMPQCHHRHLFFYTATLSLKVIPERLPWRSRIHNKQSAFQCRGQGFDPWLWN